MSERVEHGDVLRRALVELRSLKGEVQRLEGARREPIAITGMACRLPGARDPVELDRLLHEGRDASGPIPPDRWDVERSFDADPDAPGKIYVRRGGFLADPWRFDARLFRVLPREARGMDPQHRLLLEVAWEALEASGTPAESLRGARVGVFVGISTSDFGMRHPGLADARQIDATVASGIALNFAAGRLSFAFGLVGPSLTIDTACSSSLVALHLATQSLRSGECDLAIVGGTNLLLSPLPFVALCRAKMLAVDGRCKTFAATADGYARGEGVGVLVLKRRADLAADEPVHAQVLATAVNQDGPSSGITVPNGAAQQVLIATALAAAGLAPHEVGYVEAHGTGTPLGDPIELRALAAAYGPGRDPAQPLVVGSIKTNIGHLEAAAGVAGLLKAILALRDARIAPHLHFDRPSPHVDWARMPLRVPVESEAWTAPRRIAGVSAFGVSGTNAHAILEAPPARERAAEAPAGPARREVIWLSARTPEALASIATEAAVVATTAALADVAVTTQRARSALSVRRAVVAATPAELAEALARPTPPVTSGRPRIAFLFPGQGVATTGLAQGLAEAVPAFARAIERCDAALAAAGAPSASSLLAAPTPPTDTAAVQILLCSLGLALAEVWRSWGVEPELVLGHSVGEYAALGVAGAAELEDVLGLVVTRGRLMREVPARGGMLAAFAPEAAVRELLRGREADLDVAAVNGPEETIVSGDKTALAELEAALTRAGVRTRALEVANAFHSPLLDPILPAFEAAAARVRLGPARIPWISNETGGPVRTTDAAGLRRHVRAPVLFHRGVEAALAAGIDTFVELGPGATLLGLVKRIRPEGVALVPSLRAGEPAEAALLGAAARLWELGVPLASDALRAGRGGRRIATWPHARPAGDRFAPPWEDAGEGVATDGAPGSSARTASLAAWPIESPALGDRLVFEAAYDARASRVLGDHLVFDLAVVTGAAQLATAEDALVRALGWSPPLVADTLEFRAPLVLAPDERRRVQVLVRVVGGVAEVELVSRTSPEAWTTHTVARLRARDAAPATAIDLVALRARLGERWTGDEFYARLWPSGTHELGPSLRAVAEVWRDGAGTACARLVPPPAADPLERQVQLMEAAGQVIKAALPTPVDGVFVAGGAARTWIDASATIASCVARVHAPGPDGFDGEFDLLDDAGVVRGGSAGLVFRRLARETLHAVARRGAGASASRATLGLDRTALLATPPGARPAAVRDVLGRVLVHRLGLIARDLVPTASLRELGIDSLLGVELRGALAAELGLDLPATELLDDPRVDELERRVLARLPWTGGAEAAPGPSEGRGAPRPGRWVAYHEPRRAPRVRLFCLPFGGGAASIFRRWHEDLPDWIEVCPIQLPGREARLAEPAFDRLEPLVDALDEVLAPWLDLPAALFGCSMGALVAYALARRWEARGRGPCRLIVAAYPAPHLANTYFGGLVEPVEPGAPRAGTIDPRVRARARQLGVLPEALLADEDALRALLPTLVADLAVVRGYAHVEAPPLACPIAAYGGTRDAELPTDTIAAWLRHGGPGIVRLFDGPHLFLDTHRAAVLRAISNDLDDVLAPRPSLKELR